MGSDGIFDQMSNGQIIDCAWMILNNNKNNVYLKKFDEYKTNDEEEIEIQNIILKILIYMKNTV